MDAANVNARLPSPRVVVVVVVVGENGENEGGMFFVPIGGVISGVAVTAMAVVVVVVIVVFVVRAAREGVTIMLSPPLLALHAVPLKKAEKEHKIKKIPDT